jgi:hypothetical protein
MEKKSDNNWDEVKEVRMEMAMAGNTVVAAKYATKANET